MGLGFVCLDLVVVDCLGFTFLLDFGVLWIYVLAVAWVVYVIWLGCWVCWFGLGGACVLLWVCLVAMVLACLWVVLGMYRFWLCLW